MSAQAPAPVPTKYSGPHSRFSTACDGNVADWWDLDVLEGRDVKADGKWVWDTKWKHSQGYVKYKLVATTPQTNVGAEGPAEFGMKYDDEATLRFNNGNRSVNMEYKGDSINTVWDSGSHGLLDGQLWLNGFIGFAHNRKMTDRAWTGGFVSRWNGLMSRVQLRMAGLCEKVEKGLTWKLATRNEYVHDAFSLRHVSEWDQSIKAHSYMRVMAGYNAKPWGAWIEGGRLAANEKQKDLVRDHVAVSGSYDCADSGVNMAAKVTVPVQNFDTSKVTGCVGLNWTMDPEMKGMVKVDHAGDVTLHYSHKMNKNSTVFFTWVSNAKNWGNGTARKGGYMGYPFNLGFKLKYEA